MNTQDFLKTNMLCRMLAGSHAYGTNIATSDVDYRGLLFAPPEYIRTPFYTLNEVTDTSEEDTKYYEPSKKDFMFNYRVENLHELLATLKEEGVTIVGEIEEYDYGKFGWILDNDGNKIELWEPIDKAFL